MAQVATAADWAPHVNISLFTRLTSFVRSAFVMIVVDNPLAWKLGLRGKNTNDDIEGPFYLVGAPQRQIEDGKMVLASPELLQRDGPFLLVLEVKDTKGDPVPNAVLDCWQADSHGSYYFATWTLRGKMTTDDKGHAEILTVRPADYSAPLLGTRAGHIHMVASGVPGKHAPMTTQVYVCPANAAEHLSMDFANAMRTCPRQNMATCWSIRAANNGELLHNLPELPPDDVETAGRVRWWNERLEEHAVSREICAVGRHEIRLGFR